MKPFDLYYIKHPLCKLYELSDAVRASFSEQSVMDYSAEYATYKKFQQKAVMQASGYARDIVDLMEVLFNDPTSVKDSNQVKYINRALKNGLTIVDEHGKKYPHPVQVVQAVKEAKQRVESYTVPSFSMPEVPPKMLKWLEENGYQRGVHYTDDNADSMFDIYCPEDKKTEVLNNG